MKIIEKSVQFGVLGCIFISSNKHNGARPVSGKQKLRKMKTLESKKIRINEENQTVIINATYNKSLIEKLKEARGFFNKESGLWTIKFDEFKRCGLVQKFRFNGVFNFLATFEDEELADAIFYYKTK
jgi:hypothetical protein